MIAEATVSSVRACTYVVPTTFGGEPVAESDGTATWDSTGVLVVEVDAAGATGLGYAYTSPAALDVVREILAPVVLGCDSLATTEIFWAMARSLRNAGWCGITASAVSAMDVALHDLKARLLGVSLLGLLGAARDRIPVYGSGGFTSYTDDRLARQFAAWAEKGVSAMKMKVGTDAAADVDRVRAARSAVGDSVELFADANGAYDRKQALALAERFSGEARVTWFEEPVSSDDLDGLRLIRDRAPAGMHIAAGEYAYVPADFRLLLEAGAVDVLQADATRCGGVIGFAGAAQQCVARGIPLSAHTAPALHASLAASAEPAVHVEYFHDHALIEPLLFDGVPELVDGCLVPDPSAEGHGLRLSGGGREFRTAEWKS
ncbi:mandelate racemase [Planctomonas sp. JC2975]|uniref:enolase C-terminal domain-like protein n=1 Tax=Planctomonas sp. JC2975 TaxID=2729626 RepID=UPI00147382F2|nr:enolase C-terminal domain-like protein [Planctomonas sp. JC2975]NNC12133.1 mandelate racemase [Planctomonas sp. JC2975]